MEKHLRTIRKEQKWDSQSDCRLHEVHTFQRRKIWFAIVQSGSRTRPRSCRVHEENDNHCQTSIIPVPYKWDPCGKNCKHVTDQITYSMLLKWSAPHKPIYSGIVTEGHAQKPQTKMIILVYET
jgi:hypothetical protein